MQQHYIHIVLLHHPFIIHAHGATLLPAQWPMADVGRCKSTFAAAIGHSPMATARMAAALHGPCMHRPSPIPHPTGRLSRLASPSASSAELAASAATSTPDAKASSLS